ncbi:cache domain-containing protein [Pseudoduganella namucuonensis]|uniref:Single Cache domain 2-containing protein n=1 Tax=Pseudoduganella namucuonensis TaxID=1035707 RepID=A0A1I7F0Z1_9BURK|nr:cache domain-containing protein [Pseudoduganella namucuonensis]SFU29769.1 Single Cache domain 2-containing protein [Pseudoduganella namucuonensis]
MLHILKRAALGFLLLALGGAALADRPGTAGEASALVKKTIVHLKKHGRDKTLQAASHPSATFVDRDLYVSVYDLDGKVLAHGSNPKLVGVNVANLRDANDKYFIKDILAKAAGAGSGWVDYKWVDPVTRTLRDKSVYVEKADGLIIAAGYYKD